jgi:hypothetical protein
MNERCELLLSEHEGLDACDDPEHREALARRREGAPSWSPIVRGTDAGGPRDFLDGEPIHCGDVIELQGIEYRGDDYGEYTVKKPTGARVRYELSRGDAVVLYTSVMGHEFTSPLAPWMRFRWPERR